MTDFSELLGSLGGFPSQAPKSKPEKGVQIHGRRIDGVYYVRAEDIVALLELNDVLPKVTAKLKGAVK